MVSNIYNRNKLLIHILGPLKIEIDLIFHEVSIFSTFCLPTVYILGMAYDCVEVSCANISLVIVLIQITKRKSKKELNFGGGDVTDGEQTLVITCEVRTCS